MRSERAPDDGQLLSSAERGLILVTRDEDDYSLLHSAWRRWASAWNVSPIPEHHGVIVLQPDASEVLRRVLDSFISGGPLLTNELYRWRRNSGWWHWAVEQRQWVQHGG